MRDYDAIDPAYGTSDDLKRLVAAAHQRGMKVFIDIVANHTAWDSVLIGKHPDWYTHDKAGQIVPPNPDWVDVADLDYSKPALRQLHDGHDGALGARLPARWFPLRLRGRRAARLLGIRCVRNSIAPAPVLCCSPSPTIPRSCSAPSKSTTPGISTTR